MRRIFQLLASVLLVSSCGTEFVMPADSRNPLTLEYLSSNAGSCLIGGDFGDDAVWNVSQCYGIFDFHGQEFSTELLSDPSYALMIPAPLQGLNPQVVRFLHGQYVHGVERRYVRGGTVTLADRKSVV